MFGNRIGELEARLANVQSENKELRKKLNAVLGGTEEEERKASQLKSIRSNQNTIISRTITGDELDWKRKTKAEAPARVCKNIICIFFMFEN